MTFEIIPVYVIIETLLGSSMSYFTELQTNLTSLFFQMTRNLPFPSTKFHHKYPITESTKFFTSKIHEQTQVQSKMSFYLIQGLFSF